MQSISAFLDIAKFAEIRDASHDLHSFWIFFR